MAIPTQYQVIHPPIQNAMGGSAHMHTPQSIFQHMMGQQNPPQQSGPWPQMPQVPPMMMPWSVPSLQQSQLVRFTGALKSRDPSYGKIIHMKRKIEVPDVVESQRSKQFITEEKMAAHFQDMHISTNYHETPVASTSGIGEPQPCCSGVSQEACLDLPIDADPSGLEDGKSMHPRLVISEELKRLQQEPLLPATLLSKLERPSMALVLWEPPSKHLRMLSTRDNIHQFMRSTDDNGDNSNNNNNNEISMTSNNGSTNNNHEDLPDMNQEALMDEQNNIELEPMDL